MLRLLTAGESHGKGLLAILDGMPSGLKVTPAQINRELARRQKGYGRGKRMQIEKDTADMLIGVADPGITVSVGVACYPQNGTTREELFTKVDALLYKAKESGKNMVHYYKGDNVV